MANTSVSVKRYNGSTWDTVYPQTTWSNVLDKPSTFTPSSHTHDYLPLSGGTLTGELVMNARHRDTYYASNLCRHFYSGTPTQFVIKTKIKFISGTHMPLIRIYGYAYGEQSPIELRVGFYIYNDTLGWAGAVSTGAWKPEVYLFRYTENSTNYVAVGFKGACYFCGFQVDAQVGALGQFNSNFQTSEWSVTHNGADTSVNLIPAVGTDKCVQVAYRTMKTDISGTAGNASKLNNQNASYYLDYNNFTNTPTIPDISGKSDVGHTHTKSEITDFPASMPASDVYSWAKASTKPSYTHNEIGAGVLTVGDGANYLLLRSTEAWKTGMYHHTYGGEALVFGHQHEKTSFIFAKVDPASRTQWDTITTGIQIKKDALMVNKILGNNVDPSYQLDVNGTANATTLYESGTSLANKYQAKGNYLTSHQDISGKLDKSGGTMTGLLTLKTEAHHTGVKVGSTYITGISSNGRSDLILENSTLRFGADEWDYDKWAGLKYDATNKIIHLGIPDGTIFTANTPRSGGKLYLPGISSVYVGNGTTAVSLEGHTHSQYLTAHQDISGKADKVSMTAGTYKRVTVNSQGIVTAGDNTDANDNTWRKVQLDGTDKLGTGTGTNPLNIKAGSNMTITESSGTFTFAATDTTYSSKSAASGGTDVSLVTTGEKYTWNNKSNLAIGTTATTAAAGNHTHTTTLATSTGTSSITLAHGGKYALTAGGTSVIFTLPSDNNTNYYHTRVYSSGLKISTGTGVSDMYVPTGTTSSSVCVGNDSRLSDARNAAYVTTAPTAANTTGLKFAVLSSEPSTKYSGWVYIITA